MPTSTATSATRCRASCRCARAATARMPVDGNAAPAWTGIDRAGARCRACSIRRRASSISANNEIDRGFSGLITRDWAAPFRASRLRDQLTKAEGVDLDAMAALQNDRPASPPTSCWPASRRRSRPARSARDRSVVGVAARTARQLGSRRRRAAGRLALRGVRGRAVAAHVRRRDGRAAVPEVLRVGGRREAGRAVRDHRRSQVAVVRRHHHGGEARIARRHLPAGGARRRRAAASAEFGGESQGAAGTASTRRASTTRSATSAFPFRWFFNRGPVPIDGDGTTVMRVSWNRLTPFAAWEYPSWRQLFDVGAVGRVPRRHAGRPVGPPDEPVLFRSERDLAQAASIERSRSRAARSQPPPSTAAAGSVTCDRA